MRGINADIAIEPDRLIPLPPSNVDDIADETIPNKDVPPFVAFRCCFNRIPVCHLVRLHRRIGAGEGLSPHFLEIFCQAETGGADDESVPREATFGSRFDDCGETSDSPHPKP